MTRTLVPLFFVSLVLLFVPVHGIAETRARPREPHIRTTDLRLLRLVREGTETSDTFRRLVERLAHSNVVVYLECGGRGTEGRLLFVSSVAGYRYVQVRMARLASRDMQIALIGHELQHAVEIADAPQIVDEQSLEREYRKIGYRNPRPTSTAIAFDTVAAVEAGYQVLRELSSAAGD